MTTNIKHKNSYLRSSCGTQGLLCGAALLFVPLVIAQEIPEDEELFELSPFTVEGSEDQGYRATSTMAGSRIRTDLKDVGSAISVVTEDFLRDTGAVDNQSLLQYTPSTEVGGIGGNFAGDERLGLLNPNNNTRIRGLQAADNTRDYFLTDLPWDGYNVNRVDLQRGPNAILSGLGSPAGIINNTTDGASFKDEGEVQLRFGSYGSTRVHFNVNRVMLEDELAIRVAGVKKDDKYRQEEAWAEDERFFVAFKYEPKFLKSDRATTTLSANYETGRIDSNRPRTRPPVDNLSNFWKEWNGDSQIVAHALAFGSDKAYLEDGTPAGVWVRGQRVMNEVVNFEGDYPMPRTVPTLRNIHFNNPYYGNNYTVGPILYFGNADKGDGNPTFFSVNSIATSDNNVITVGEGGQIVRDSSGTGMITYFATTTSTGLGSAARQLGLPLADYGGYGDELIYDRSIFDYKNHLIDGDNKRELQDFNVGTVNVSQTLWDNRVGIEAALNSQSYEYGQTSPFGWSPRITIDANAYMADLVTPNPNAGRPVIMQRTQGASSLNNRKRVSDRYTVFGELREGDIFEADSFLGKLFGKQRVTGLKSSDDITFYEMRFKNWLAGDSYRTYQGTAGLAQNESEVMAAIYMGPSVVGTSGPSGLNLQPVPKLNPKGISEITYWDSNWADPTTRTVEFLTDNSEGGGWYHPWNQNYASQQDNPNNYVGWSTMPVEVLVDTEGDRASLITTARSKTEEISSEAFVYQGYFWGGAVVATYGTRDDSVLQYNVTAPRIETESTTGLDTDQGVFNRNIFDPSGATPFAESGGDYLNYTPADAKSQEPSKLGGVNRYTGTNESKSLVVHLDAFLPDLPLDSKISVFWNESSNFQPAETRVDHLNQPLAPPSGTTEDYGFLIRTLNDRLTLKVNRYQSTVTGSSFDPGNLWYVGTAETSLFTVGMRDKAFLDGVEGWDSSWRAYANFPYKSGDRPWEAYLAERGEASRDQTAEEAQAWQERALANFYENLAPQEFWDAWGATKSDWRWQNGKVDPSDESTGAIPAGFTSTSDLISKGTEIEVTYQPTKSWNIAFNATKTEAIRDNLAGSLKEWVEARNLIHNGDSGDIRLWWSGDRANTLKTRWNSEFYSKYQLALAQEGQSQPEIREWRANLITNYSFRDGKFKGLSVGGSLRWEDEVGIGYPQSEGTTVEGNKVVVYDTSRPYTGPSETHVDLWAGYSLDLNESVKWRIQLNVRDALADGELIPLSVNPDGSIREFRVTSDPNWFLTNTFTF